MYPRRKERTGGGGINAHCALAVRLVLNNLLNLELLEKLNAIAAVDSTSEVMATAGLISLVVGEAMVSILP